MCTIQLGACPFSTRDLVRDDETRLAGLEQLGCYLRITASTSRLNAASIILLTSILSKYEADDAIATSLYCSLCCSCIPAERPSGRPTGPTAHHRRARRVPYRALAR